MYASSTYELAHYSARFYAQFYREHEHIEEFKKKQPTLFPINQATYVGFLFWARVTKKRAFNTVMNACVHGLNLYCMMKSVTNFDYPQQEYGKVINATLITLLHAFGNTKRKTEVLLTEHFFHLMKNTNFAIEDEVRNLAIIAFICLGTYRSNSIEHMQLGDLAWSLAQEGPFKVRCQVTMRKDKHLLSKPHVNSLETHMSCTDFLLVFMLYLWDYRKIGECSSLAEAFTTRNLKMKDEFKTTPIFTIVGSNFVPVTDFWTLLVTFGKNKLPKQFTVIV